MAIVHVLSPPCLSYLLRSPEKQKDACLKCVYGLRTTEYILRTYVSHVCTYSVLYIIMMPYQNTTSALGANICTYPPQLGMPPDVARNAMQSASRPKFPYGGAFLKNTDRAVIELAFLFLPQGVCYGVHTYIHSICVSGDMSRSFTRCKREAIRRGHLTSSVQCDVWRACICAIYCIRQCDRIPQSGL